MIELIRNQKISHSDYVKFRAAYNAKGTKQLRFGQAFLNKFGDGISFPELYYETNKDKAESLIYRYFIKFDQGSKT